MKLLAYWSMVDGITCIQFWGCCYLFWLQNKYLSFPLIRELLFIYIAIVDFRSLMFSFFISREIVLKECKMEWIIWWVTYSSLLSYGSKIVFPGIARFSIISFFTQFHSYFPRLDLMLILYFCRWPSPPKSWISLFLCYHFSVSSCLCRTLWLFLSLSV